MDAHHLELKTSTGDEFANIGAMPEHFIGGRFTLCYNSCSPITNLF
jgi:hypothetical protein